MIYSNIALAIGTYTVCHSLHFDMGSRTAEAVDGHKPNSELFLFVETAQCKIRIQDSSVNVHLFYV